MTHRRVALILTLLTFTLVSSVQAAEIQWGDSLNTALKESKKSGKPILIDFYADWCGWCKRLDSDVYTDPTVIQSAEKFIRVKLNTETNGLEAAQKYNVSTLPAILIINASGEVQERFTGFSPAPQFNTRLINAAQTIQELPGLLKRFKENETDLEAATQLTKIYARRGDTEGAQRTLARVATLDPNDEKSNYAKALNAVADMYANQKNLDEAVALFQKGLKVAHDGKDLGYSQMSLAVCQFMRRDLTATKTELLAAIDNPRLPDNYKTDAREMLSQLEKAMSEQGATDGSGEGTGTSVATETSSQNGTKNGGFGPTPPIGWFVLAGLAVVAVFFVGKQRLQTPVNK